MAEVNVAYDTLSDAAAHKLYRATLASTHRKCAPCAGEGGMWKQRGFSRKVFERCATCAGAGVVKK